MRSFVILLTLVGICAAGGCSTPKTPKKDTVIDVPVQTEDDLTRKDGARLEQLANEGDVAAAKRLRDHYGSIDDHKDMLRWITWLAAKKDADALVYFALNNFIDAGHLSDRDPGKMTALLTANKFCSEMSSNVKDGRENRRLCANVSSEIERLKLQ